MQLSALSQRLGRDPEVLGFGRPGPRCNIARQAIKVTMVS
jgi:hypothetical protein